MSTRVVVAETPTVVTVAPSSRVVVDAPSTTVITTSCGDRVIVERSNVSVVTPSPERIVVDQIETRVITAATQGPRGVPGPAGSARGVYSRLNSTGSTIPAGTPVRLTADGTMALARADSADRRAVGLTGAAVPHDAEGDIVLWGPLQLDNWSTPTGGSATLSDAADYYLVQTLAGLISLSPPGGPGDLLQRLGFAIAPDTLWVDIDTIAVC